MLSLNRVLKFLLILILLNASLCFAGEADVLLYKGTVDKVRSTLNKFNCKGFDVYLTEVTNDNMQDYNSVLCLLFKDYISNFKKFNTCVSKNSGLEKKYDNKWIDELFKVTNREYVKNNIKSFQNLLFNINNKFLRENCIENEKEAIFSEVQYVAYLKNYLKLYLSYFETLSDNDKKKYINTKKSAKSILKDEDIATPPTQRMIYPSQLGDYLNIDYNVELRPEIIKFIVNNPTFTKPFDYMKAIIALRNALK